jgi:hypothetical protein
LERREAWVGRPRQIPRDHAVRLDMRVEHSAQVLKARFATRQVKPLDIVKQR